MPLFYRLLALRFALAFGMLALIPSAGAQPRLYVGLDAGYVQGAAGGSTGATAAPSLGLRWGRLVAEARPAEYAFNVDAGLYCDGQPDDPGVGCGRATQSSLSSSLDVAYALPVHGPLALTAGAGVRARWYEQRHAYSSAFEGTPDGTGWERPHLVLGARYDLSERLSVALRTETQVYQTVSLPGDPESGGLHPQVSRATVGLTLRLGR